MNKFFIVLILLFPIKSERWYSEVKGHNQSDPKSGFAGDDCQITAFYLCSERKYRIHNLNGDWSEEFTACQPAGEGKHIDGIAISGGLLYSSANSNENWKNASGYNISDSDDGYAGILDEQIYRILV